MMIQERLKRSNLIMLVVPVAVADPVARPRRGLGQHQLLPAAVAAIRLPAYLRRGGHHGHGLPGISGSSILLIAGVYLPTIQAVHSLMGLQLAVLPGLCTPGFGVLAGVAISISAIRAALQKYRSQMIWLILGLMLGSLYTIANGPASLAAPRPALSMATFQPVGFVLGAAVLLVLEGAKMMMERKEQPGVPIVKGAKQA